MKVEGAVALVTGANRGFGAALCRVLLEQGAATVYGGARDPATVATPGIVPVRLDITSQADVDAAADRCAEVTLLVNNAGIPTGTAALAPDAMEKAHLELATNVLGPLAMCRAFAPVLRTNGGGAIINVLSVLSWVSSPGTALYCASKAASWSLTNSIRQELLAQHTQVLALHVGFMDTDMTARVDAPKSSPDDVAARAIAALESGAHEVLADDVSRRVRAGLSGELTDLYPALATPVRTSHRS